MGVSDGQGSLARCGPRGPREPDTTEQLNWTDQRREWQGYAFKPACWKLETKTWFYFFMMIFHKSSWENPTTQRGHLVQEERLYSHGGNAGPGGSDGLAPTSKHTSTPVPQHRRWHAWGTLRWPGKDSAVSSPRGDAFAKSLLFSYMALWVLDKRQYTLLLKKEMSKPSRKTRWQMSSRKEVFFFSSQNRMTDWFSPLQSHLFPKA